MNKKTIVSFLAVLALSTPALAIELPENVAKQDGTVLFDNSPTAYSSSYVFNSILGEYGLALSPAAVADVPSTYAKVVDDKVVFNKDSIAYTPTDYHKILTAYGVGLTPEAVTEKLGGLSYAKVVEDKISFSNTPTAYSRAEWIKILSAYNLPMVAAAPVPVPAPAKAKPMDSDGDGVLDNMDACPGTPAGVAVNARGCWAMSSEMLFDLNSAVIKKNFYPVLNSAKKTFEAYPNMKVQVEGHADSTGSEAYNQSLSLKRAQAVVNYLTNKLGIAPSRLKAVGFGESKPAVSNATREGRAQNRRVVFSPMM